VKIGVVFPQTEIGADAARIKSFAQAAEALGYQHLLAYDHVLGASTKNRPEFAGPYTSSSMFHEVFVLFGYLAGLTESLEFVTGVLILPQRQTVLVAKQAAEVDRLSNGRLRLGIGVGWNAVEYEGLNENFRDRGKRSEEQIALMRALWTQDVIDFDGRWHRIQEAGINPLPVQQPIPIWIGGYAPATMKRVGRIADGWFPKSQPGEAPTDEVRSDVANIHESAIAAGRDPSAIGVEPRIRLSEIPRNQWSAVTGAWRAAGATHLSVITMDAGLDVDAQIEQLRDYAETVGLS
jgi:probable F420-dependent oxidoreductase